MKSVRVGTTSLWDAKCTYFRACSPNISKDWNLNLFWRETGIFSISAARVCHWVSRTECTRSRVVQIPEQEGRFKSHSFEKLGQQARNYVVFVSLCRFLPTLVMLMYRKICIILDVAREFISLLSLTINSIDWLIEYIYMKHFKNFV